jgi:superfamily II DNA/RNA helicase
MSQDSQAPLQFAQLGLSEPVMQAVTAIGYETPSPIQAATIPAMLEGRDVLGQAQTGTGKTAAFALPVLSNIDLQQIKPQALILAPTRELAIQVAEAFQSYSSKIPASACCRCTAASPTASSCRRCAAACTSWSVPRPRDRPPGPQHPGPVRAEDAGAGRSR